MVEEYIEKSLIRKQLEHELHEEKAETIDPDTELKINEAMSLNFPEKVVCIEIKATAVDGGPEITMLSDVCLTVTYKKIIAESVRISLHLNLGRDTPVMGLSPYRLPLDVNDEAPGTYKLSTVIPAGWLNTGLFTIDFVAIDEKGNLLIYQSSMCYFKVQLKIADNDLSKYSGKYSGPLMPVLKWQVLAD